MLAGLPLKLSSISGHAGDRLLTPRPVMMPTLIELRRKRAGIEAGGDWIEASAASAFCSGAARRASG